MNVSQQFRRACIAFFILICFCSEVRSQKVAIKTNAAYWATTTPNLSLEVALGSRNTLDVSGGFNIFTFSDNKTFKHWLIQPELRWWFCETFNGHFIGLHAHAAKYNVGGWDIPIGRLDVFKNLRYEGHLYGGGLSYGYQWILSPRWNFEFNVGGGYARIHNEEYPCKDCGTKLDEGDYNYWGITRVDLSIIYFFK